MVPSLNVFKNQPPFLGISSFSVWHHCIFQRICHKDAKKDIKEIPIAIVFLIGKQNKLPSWDWASRLGRHFLPFENDFCCSILKQNILKG